MSGVKLTPEPDDGREGSQSTGGSDPTVRPPIPTPPGGDTRLSGEVEKAIADLAPDKRMFPRGCWGQQARQRAAALLRQLAAERDEYKAQRDALQRGLDVAEPGLSTETNEAVMEAIRGDAE